MQYLESNLIEMIDAELKGLDDANKKIDALERDLKMDVSEIPEIKPDDAPATPASPIKLETVDPNLSSGDEDKENKEEIDLSLLCEETMEPERKRLKRTTSVPEDEDENEPPNAEEQKIDAELEHLDMSLIKLLAFQRIQQILAENPVLVDKYHNRTAAKAIRELIQKEPKRNNLLLPSELLTKEDIAKIARKFTAAAAKDGAHVREDGYESRSPSPVFTMEETSTTPGGAVTEMKIEDIRKSAEAMDKSMAADSYWRSQIRARAGK
jgi:hypothetical protein